MLPCTFGRWSPNVAGLRRAPLEVEAKADESPVTKADREVLSPALLN